MSTKILGIARHECKPDFFLATYWVVIDENGWKTDYSIGWNDEHIPLISVFDVRIHNYLSTLFSSDDFAIFNILGGVVLDGLLNSSFPEDLTEIFMGLDELLDESLED